MDFTLSGFLGSLAGNPPLIIMALLVSGVILVNGWTDAPNAIATCVSTRSIGPRAAVMMAAIFNFFGVFVMTLINKKVAETISTMVNFSSVSSGKAANPAMIALCAALFGIVIWATAAWYFGIPTSESHALIAGLSGSAIAMGGMKAINLNAWVSVLVGLVLSTFLGFSLGWIIIKLIELIFKNASKSTIIPFFKGGQIASGAMMAFMHGAQDGQKFMGVFILGMFLVNGYSEVPVEAMPEIPLWLIVFVSMLMGLGTSIGGYRIIKSVGMDMVKLKTHQGFASDLAASICLLIASLWNGIPVSTTHTKTTSIMGVGAAKRLSAVNWGVVKEMVLTWVLTFPGCGLVSYFITLLAIKLF